MSKSSKNEVEFLSIRGRTIARIVIDQCLLGYITTMQARTSTFKKKIRPDKSFISGTQGRSVVERPDWLRTNSIMTKVSGKCNFRAFFLESRGIETKARGCYFPMIPNGWQKQGRGPPSCPGFQKKIYFVDAHLGLHPEPNWQLFEKLRETLNVRCHLFTKNTLLFFPSDLFFRKEKYHFGSGNFFPGRVFFRFWVIFGKDSKSQTNLLVVFLVNSEVTMESKKKLDHFSRGVYWGGIFLFDVAVRGFGPSAAFAARSTK